ncbi:MAG: DoxX family protein [Planctomycetota bacterium]|nr:DoxX family protein [Planctomycetota bacterium]
MTPIAVLRIYLGIALAIKGIYFILNMGELEAQMEGTFGHAQTVVAWFVVFAHSVGGACLALGLATRLVAAVNAVVLSGAVLVHLTGAPSLEMLGANLNFQFAMLVLVTLVIIFWQGAGGFSMDRMVREEDGSPAASLRLPEPDGA